MELLLRKQKLLVLVGEHAPPHPLRPLRRAGMGRPWNAAALVLPPYGGNTSSIGVNSRREEGAVPPCERASHAKW